MSRILLADDSPHAQRMGERILREEGYEVVTVTDGDTALRRLSEIDPDLIVADVFLPRVSGFELCRKVKAQDAHKHVRVIMTAGTLEVFDEDEARRAGADAIIKKPFEATAVVEVIKPLIKQANSERDHPRKETKKTKAVDINPVVIVENLPELKAPELKAKVVEPPPPPPVPEPVVGGAGLQPGDSAKIVAAPLDLEPELVRAAVTVALDEIMPLLIDDITERVMAAMRKN